MATVTKTFTFLADAEGYVATAATGVTLAYNSTVGNPAGSLSASTANKNVVAAPSYWEWSGTWESLGVPVGATVTAARLTSASTICAARSAHATTTDFGPYELRDSAAALIGTLWAGRTATGAETAWVVTPAQALVTVPNHASSTSVRIRLADTIATGGGGGAPDVRLHDDEVSIEVTYSDPPVAKSASETLTPVIVEGAGSVFAETPPPVAIAGSDTLTPVVREAMPYPGTALYPGDFYPSEGDSTIVVGSDTYQNKAASDTLTPTVTDNSSNTATTVGTIVSTWLGAVTTTSAQVVAVTSSTTSVRIAYSTDPGLAGASFSASLTPTAEGVTRHTISGLTANTTYYYGLEMNGLAAESVRGDFATAPSGPASFSFAFSSCRKPAVTGYTTGTVNRIKALNPAFFVQAGDFHYEHQNRTTDFSVAEARTAWDTVVNEADTGSMLSTIPTAWVWDDHDYSTVDNGNINSASRTVVAQVARERAALYPVPDSANIGLWQTFVWGRVRIILLDPRSYRSPQGNADDAAKTMLGAEQKAWLLNTLDNSTEPIVAIFTGVPWVAAASAGADHWGGYTTERTELVNEITSRGHAGRVVMCAGDMHALAYEDGSASPGGFPSFQAGPMAQNSSHKGGPYDAGPLPASTGVYSEQFALMTVTDNGTTISMQFSGRNSANTEQMTYTVTKIAPVSSDTLTPKVSDTSSVAISLVSSDTIQPSVAETSSFGTVSVSASDAFAPALLESSSVNNSGLAQDAFAPVVSESSSVLVPLSGADTIAPTLTEGTGLLVSATSSDTVTPTVTETTNIGTLALLSGSDVVTPTLAETSSVSVISLVVGSDTLQPSVAEASSFGTISVSASDTNTPIVIDSSGTQAAFGASDVVVPAIVDGSTRSISGLAQDVFTPTISETAAPIAVSVTSTETIAPSIADSALAHTVINAADTVTPGLTETSSVAVGALTQDTLAATVAESSSLHVTASGSDTLAPSLADSIASLTVNISGSDIGKPVIIEEPITIVQNTPLVEHTSADTLTPKIADSGVVASYGTGADLLVPAIVDQSSLQISGQVDKTSSDILTPAVVDAVQVTAFKSSADTLVPVVSDASTTPTIIDYKSGSDTLVPAVSDASTAPVASGGSNISSNDPIAPKIVETSTIIASVSSPDTLTPKIVDSSALGTIAITGADTIKPTVVESSGFSTMPISSSDTVKPVVAESAVVIVPISSLDTLAPAIVEASAFGTVAVTGVDSIQPALGESSQFAPMPISSSDTLVPAIVDAGTKAESMSHPGADILAPTMQETSSIVTTGNTAVLDDDVLTPKIVESSTRSISVDRPDTISPTLTESSSIAVFVAQSDVIAPVVTESAGVFLAISSTDSLTPKIVDAGAASQLIAISASDTMIPRIVDQFGRIKNQYSNVVKIWNGTTWIQGRAGVWTGSSWHTPRIKVWNGQGWV